MNTQLTEHKSEQQFNIDWKNKVVEDYYAEYYPSPRVEKAIFKYLDELYYVSDDDVFFTIYKKDNDWFMKIDDIAKEIEKLFGLSLPDEIKIGDEYIQPARNPIPNKVIKNWTKHSKEKQKEEDSNIENVREVEEDLENWGFDGKEIGPLKEHANPKLINKFLKEFWPEHRSQLYSQLYNTYHPSNYVESFNRPSMNFENALEMVADAVHEGKKLGLIDSSVDWSDTVHYDFRGNSVTKFNKDNEEWEDTKRLIDDDGIPTLNDQLEIMDNTNLDWIHGILLFDVLEEIVDEFKHYCGENGIDESGMGKCMDEFPPSPNQGPQPTPYDGGTLKQDYYTLFNFMRELERAGVPVTDYLKDPTFPNIIKLVDDGTTDYNEEGGDRNSADWENIRTQTEFEMDAPDRLYEEVTTPEQAQQKRDKIKNIEDEIKANDGEIKSLEQQILDLDKKAKSKAKPFGWKQEKEKEEKEGPPIEQAEQVQQYKLTPYAGAEEDEEDEFDKKNRKNSTEIINLDIEMLKVKNQTLNNQLNVLKKPSTPSSDSPKPMGKPTADDTQVKGTVKPLKVVKIPDAESETIAEHEDLEDDYENEDYVDNTPFTRTEALILKTLHRDLSKEELLGITEETPGQWSPVDKKFWGIMKLFGMDYSSGGPEDNVMVSRYAKWAYDNWTEEGDYANIEKPIKVPLKWYDIDIDETGSQVEYKSGSAEVMGWDEDDAEDRAMDDFYSWGGELETHDWGDYESYETDVNHISFSRLAEQMDPAIKYNVDQQYRTNPELRDEILKALADEEHQEDIDGYYLNPDVDSPMLDVPPRKIAQKFSDANNYGEIKFDIQGGKGIAYFTDKNLVIKLTGDESEYETANKLVGIDNEYIVKVLESAKIKTKHSNLPIFVIIEEALPMTEEMEEKWLQCCCGQDSPIYIDYLTQPTLVLPPVANQDICLPIYDNIMEIQKNFAEYGIIWSDIGIDNLGIKNGKLAVVDLGETVGGTSKGKELELTLENIKIRPLTTKQIKKQLILI